MIYLSALDCLSPRLHETMQCEPWLWQQINQCCVWHESSMTRRGNCVVVVPNNMQFGPRSKVPSSTSERILTCCSEYMQELVTAYGQKMILTSWHFQSWFQGWTSFHYWAITSTTQNPTSSSTTTQERTTALAKYADAWMVACHLDIISAA